MDPVIHLSPAAEKYLVALEAPWNFAADGACIPVMPAFSSFKCGVFSRGEMEVGTQGMGFIMARLGVAASDSICGCFSASQSFITSNMSDGAAGVTTFTHNGPFVSTDLGVVVGKVQGRSISTGLRIRYIGEERLCSGEIILFEQPNHENIDNTSISNARDYLTTRRLANTTKREWITIVSHPVRESELVYTDDDNLNGGNWSMAIAIGGATPGITFEYEYFQRLEYIGDLTADEATSSNADMTGFGIVNDAAGFLYENGRRFLGGMWDSKTMMTGIATAMKNVMDKSLSYVVPAVTSNLAASIGLPPQMASGAGGAVQAIFSGRPVTAAAAVVTPSLAKRYLSPTLRAVFAKNADMELSQHFFRTFPRLKDRKELLAFKAAAERGGFVMAPAATKAPT
jgi:hypothetical protein